MKGLTVVLGFCLIAVAFGAPSARIVGGHDAPAGKYPFIVSLQVEGKHRCAGIILNRRYIETAAQCIVGLKAEEVTISAGTYDLSKPFKFYGAESLIPYPEYNSETKEHDIGLIRVNEDIVFDYPFVYPVNTAGTGEAYYPGDEVTVIGYGSTDKNGPSPVNLQELVVRLASINSCKAAFPHVTTYQFCTVTTAQQGICHGDVGSPLIDGKALFMGFVSYGTPCETGRPVIYTRHNAYREWVWKQFV